MVYLTDKSSAAGRLLTLMTMIVPSRPPIGRSRARAERLRETSCRRVVAVHRRGIHKDGYSASATNARDRSVGADNAQAMTRAETDIWARRWVIGHADLPLWVSRVVPAVACGRGEYRPSEGWSPAMRNQPPVKPSAQPALVRTQHPPQMFTAPGLWRL